MEWLNSALPGITPGEILLIWVTILLAALLRAFTGFGFALAAVPVFALFLTPAQSVVLTSSLALGIGIITAPTFLGKVELKPQLPLFIMAALGTLFGVQLLVQMSPAVFQLCIGVAIIAACAALTFYKPSQHRPRPIAGGLTGLASGLLGGAFAIPGPPVIVYAMATEAEPARARALLISFFTVSAFFGLVLYASRGLVSLESLWLFLISIPVMYLGDRVGLLLFQRFGTSLYRQVAIVTLFVIGMTTLLRGLSSA